MDSALFSSQIDRLDRKTDHLREEMAEMSKEQVETRASLKYLSSTIEKLSCSIDKLTESQNSRGFVEFIKKNWFRMPAAVALFCGIVWFGAYVNDRFIPESKKYQNFN